MEIFSLKQLSTLDWEHRCSKTSMPKLYVPKNKYTDANANGLTKAIIVFLQLHEHQAERINTTGRVIDERKLVTNILGQTGLIGSTKYIPGTGTKGSADISAILRTNKMVVIPWKIEVKIGKDRQSEAQKKYELDIKKAGGHYSLVKTWDDFYSQYICLIND